MPLNTNYLLIPSEFIKTLERALHNFDKLPLTKEERDGVDSIYTLMYNPNRNEKNIEEMVNDYIKQHENISHTS